MGSGRDLSALKKDGSEINVEIGLNPIETPDGQMVLASIIDVSLRKSQENIIKNQIAELEIKNKELEQFSYIASHDLQEPLRTISNYIQIFEEDYKNSLDETSMQYLKSIKTASKRMGILIKSLLEHSRIGRNRIQTTVDVKRVISDVINDMNDTIQATKTEIQVSNMPVLLANETDIRQLFQNFISNAIKYQKSDSQPKITITCEKFKEKWRFAISDNGIGIAKEHYSKIFNIFQRLHTQEEYEGNGIGLANCKKIIESHKGELSVESKVGSGSTFYFTL